MNAPIRECLARFGGTDAVRGVSVGGEWIDGDGATLTSRSPIDGTTIARFASATPAHVDRAAENAATAFAAWRLVPAPVRGQFVRAFAERLRRHKADLAALVTIESGKI